MVRPEAGVALPRVQAPGCARDHRQRTCVSAELAFFNDEVMAARFITAAVEPVLADFPTTCRIADFGGADGFLAQAIRDHLGVRGINATTVVVDGNARTLALAQQRGLKVVPGSLESVRLAPVSAVAMRLVLHYNSLASQVRILQRAFDCLLPGGYLLLQAEAGDRSSATFRNLVVSALEQNQGPGRCRWLASESLQTLVLRRGFEVVLADTDSFVFETPLDTLLQLAWTRFHGAPEPINGSQSGYAEFYESARKLAERLRQRKVAPWLRTDETGSIWFTSRHALIVARKPS